MDMQALVVSGMQYKIEDAAAVIRTQLIARMAEGQGIPSARQSGSATDRTVVLG
jgi:hypothetical protein